MDYQFTRSIIGEAIAEIEGEQSLFGQWLSGEWADQNADFDLLESKFAELENDKLAEYVIVGKDFNLRLNAQEVDISLKSLPVDEDLLLPEGTELNEDEESAGCGLADFKLLMAAWRDFLRS